jgi:hypothetical protein
MSNLVWEKNGENLHATVTDVMGRLVWALSG